jgi:hypothetical protein
METWSPHRFLGIVRTIKLDDFIQKLDLWCDIQKWGISHCSPPSWHGKVFSKIWKDLPWMITMSFDIISPKKSKHSAFIGLQTTCWSHLSSTPILWQPIHRWPFQLHIDCNNLGFVTTFFQVDDEGKKFMVAYTSHSNNETKANYTSYKRSPCGHLGHGPFKMLLKW